MPNLNKVMLMGNLTRDPQLSYLANQTAACEIGLAINRRWTDKDGQTREETTFVDCQSYGRQAETLSKYLKKGRPVYIEGRLKLDQWEAQDGTKRYKMRIIVEGFQFIDGGGRTTSGPSDGSEGAEGEAPAPRRAAPVRAAPPARPAPSRAPVEPAPAMNHDDEQPPMGDEDIPF